MTTQVVKHNLIDTGQGKYCSMQLWDEHFRHKKLSTFTVNMSLITLSCESIYTAKLRALGQHSKKRLMQVVTCHKSLCTVVHMLVHNHKSL